MLAQTSLPFKVLPDKCYKQTKLRWLHGAVFVATANATEDRKFFLGNHLELDRESLE